MPDADAGTVGLDGASALNTPGVLLRSLHIENLKSLLGSHEVGLAPLTLIYGPNAAGKTSVLQSIRLVQHWLKLIRRPLIESEEWETIVSDHARMISGHDETRSLTLGMAYSSVESGSAPEQLTLAVRRSEHHEVGFQVTLTTSGASEVASTTFQTAEEPSWPGYRFLPESRGAVPGGDDRLLHSVFFLGPHRGDPGERGGPDEHRRPESMPWWQTTRGPKDESINAWLSRLDVPFKVRAVLVEEADPDAADVLNSIDRSADWADERVPLPSDFHHWELIDTRSGVQVRLEDIGYGVGQLLPIIDFCTREADQVICIEQPELHLHPRLQGNLGELFVDSVIRGDQIIAETHSENILLRVRRLIREQHIAADDVAVVYVDNTDAGVMISRLRLGSSGELLDPWPSGFFDDSLADILGATP